MAQYNAIKSCQKHSVDWIVKGWGPAGWMFFIAVFSGVIGGIGMQLDNRWSNWRLSNMFHEKPVLVSPEFFLNTSIVTSFLSVIYVVSVYINALCSHDIDESNHSSGRDLLTDVEETSNTEEELSFS